MNNVQLIGRLTRDPELRVIPSGTAVCTIRLAVPRRKKDGAEQAPDYVDVTTFGAQAEAIAEHVAQGRQVAVTGRDKGLDSSLRSCDEEWSVSRSIVPTRSA